MSGERIESVRRMWPLVLLVTALVIALPIAAVYWLRRTGVTPALWECIGCAFVVALVTVGAASAYWQRRKPGADLMFGELMLWGWLRRLRLERQLRDASRLLAEVTAHSDQAGFDRDAAAAVLARVVDAYQALDAYTAGHSRRVARMATSLAHALGLSSEQVHTIRAAGAVHDVGKLRVPTEILNKPGSLSPEEYELVKRHAVEGAAIVAGLGDSELTSIVRHHHERVDGAGYPDALAGEQIPIGARVIAVVDTYDAIIAARPYRPAEPHKLAMRVLIDDMGAQFDPEIVRAFVRSYSPRRAVLLWSALELAVVRAFAWARIGAAPPRPSSPWQHASNAAAVGGLAVLAAVAAAAVGRHAPTPPSPPASTAAVVAAVVPTPPVHRPRRAARHEVKLTIPLPTPLTPRTASRRPIVTSAAPVDPSITSLRAGCRRMTSFGGGCLVRWAVANARACTLSAAPALAGQLPLTVKCRGQRTLHLPANTSGAERRWGLTLTATGAPATSPAHRTIVVAVPPATPGPQIAGLSGGCALPAGGGDCSITWQVRDATSCTLTASPHLSPQLPVTLPCSSGVGEYRLHLPPNSATASVSWAVTLTARGAPATSPVSRPTTITVAGRALAPAQPSIGALTAQCATLPARGGPCIVSWTVANARTCTLAVTPALAGQLPATMDCTSGAGQLALELPANQATVPQTWTVTLIAAAAATTTATATTATAGATIATRQVTITVAARPPSPEILSLGASCGDGHERTRVCVVQWTVRAARTCTLSASPALAGQLPVTADCSSGTGRAELELPARVRDSAPDTWVLTLTVVGADGTTPAIEQTTVAGRA